MILLIGYLSSLFLAVSLVVTRALWFRWINLLGCFTFVLYGALIGAFPVMLANGILVVINIIQIVKLYTRTEHFEHVQVQYGDEIVESFLKYYRKDIHLYFPEFRFTTDTDRICFMVLRDAAMANLFVAKKAGEGEIVVEINYTVPEFRDYKVGQFIFEEESDYLRSRGVRTVYTKSYYAAHTQFLVTMGFEEIEFQGEPYFQKQL